MATKAYFLSHNCLGDNITNTGAIRYLVQTCYSEIFFVCKQQNLSNLRLIFSDPRVHLVPVVVHDERFDYHPIIDPIYDQPDIDVLVSG